MKNYRIRESAPENVKKELSGYSEILQNLLFNRDIVTKDGAESFLNPEYERDTNDPYLLKDIKKASKRILDAIKRNEKILIYSDYDADGIPGAVILHDFFKKAGFKNFENYIPHRNDEGFGLNNEAVIEFQKKGFKLIITIDCGINDIKEVKKAKELKIDVIITDHHLPGAVVPDAYAIVNPNQKGDKYPFKQLCGSAVIFKLVQVLIQEGGFDIKSGWDKWLLDMVGLATISDMVPLNGENRTFSYYGLLVLRKTRRPGLISLYEEAYLHRDKLSEDDICFVVTPRINAASRMDDVYTAFNLLKSEEEAEAKAGAKKLTELNNKRKVITASMVKEIKSKLSKRGEIPKIIVAGNTKWVPSILGLVAGNLANEFNRPVFLWGQNGYEEIRGSCRSEQKTDVFSLMHKLPKDFFIHFGGHKFSGGFGILNKNVHFLEEELLKSFEETDGPDEDDSSLIDAVLPIEKINRNLYNEISRLAPFGTGNPKPVFLINNLLVKSIEKFGKNKEHLKLNFTSSQNIQAISFFSDENSFSSEVSEGSPINLVASLEESYFRNYPELRLRIVDII